MNCDKCRSKHYVIPKKRVFRLIIALITLIAALITLTAALVDMKRGAVTSAGNAPIINNNNQNLEKVIEPHVDYKQSGLEKITDENLTKSELGESLKSNREEVDGLHVDSKQSELEKSNDQVDTFDTAFTNRGLQQIIDESYVEYSLDIQKRGDGTHIRDFEIIGENLARSKLWRDSVILYHYLFTKETTGGRRKTIVENLHYTNNKWISEDDFIRSISNDSVKAITNVNLRLRHEPVLDENNIIKVLQTNQEAQVLERSDFKEAIDGPNTYYWYKILIDGIEEGWVYGKYLFFYPDHATVTDANFVPRNGQLDLSQ